MSPENFKTSGRSLRQIEDPVTKRVLETILSNIDSFDKRLSTLEGSEPVELIDLTLKNGWVQYGNVYSLPKYSVSKSGTVHLYGLIKSGTTTTGTVLFSLPSGSRPDKQLLINVQSNGLIGRIDIKTNGDVIINSGSNVWLSLDNITFQAFR